MSIKPEPVHYHRKLECIRKAHQKFYARVVFRQCDKEAMDELHLELLRDQVGIN